MAGSLKLSDADKLRFLNQCPALRGVCSDELAKQFELRRYERNEQVFLYLPAGPKPPLRQLGVVVTGHIVVSQGSGKHVRRTCGPMSVYGEQFAMAYADSRGDEGAQRAALREPLRAIAAEPTWALELPPDRFASAVASGSRVAARLREARAIFDIAPDVLSVLSITQELANVEDDDLLRLLEGAEVRAVEPGRPVLQGGQVPDRICVLLEGAFRFTQPGSTTTTAKLPAPAAIGVAELIHGRPMTFDVIATGSTRVVYLRAETFWRLYALDPDFQRAIVRTNQLDPGALRPGHARVPGANVFLVMPDEEIRVAHPGVAGAIRGLTDLLAESIATHLYDNVLVLHLGPPGSARRDVVVRYAETWAEHRYRPVTGEGAAEIIASEAALARPSAGDPQGGGAPDVTLIEVSALEDAEPVLRGFASLASPHKLIQLLGEPDAQPPIPMLISQTEVIRTAVLDEADPTAGIGRALHRADAAGEKGALAYVKSAAIEVPSAAAHGLLSAGARLKDRITSLLGRAGKQAWPMGTVRVRFRPGALAALKAPGDTPASFASLPAEDLAATQRTIDRWARAVTSRRVGLSLGGGGTYGDVHIPFIKKLEQEGIPIDVIAGASVGSTIGAYYATLGSEGLDLFWKHRDMIVAASAASFVSSAALEWAISYDLGGIRLDQTETPFFPVVTDADVGLEWDVREGTYALGVRASGSLPPLIGPTVVGGRRYLDGGLVANVPVNVLRDEGVSLIIASNPIASVKPRERQGGARVSFVGDFLLESNPRLRVNDTLRMVPMIFRTTGESQTGNADITFRPAAGDASLASIADPTYVEDAELQLALNQAVADAHARWRRMLRHPPARVRLSEGADRIEVRGWIGWDGASVDPRCVELLGEVAAFLQEHAEIQKLRVVVASATEIQGAQRAAAVMEHLVLGGVDRARFDDAGGLAEPPPAPGALVEDRLELRITQRADARELQRAREALAQTQAQLAAAEAARARAEASAQARGLTLVAARECVHGDLDLACMLGIEAAAIHEGPATSVVLRMALGRTGRMVARYPSARPAQDLAWRPDGRHVAVGNADGIVRIWDASAPGRCGAGDPEPLAEISHRGASDPGIRGLSWSPNGRRLASAGLDGRLRIHDVRDDGTVSPLAELDTGTWDTWGVAFSPEGERVLATVDGDRSRLAILALGAAGLERGATLDHAPGNVRCAAWSPDGVRVAVGTTDGTASLWGAGGELLARWKTGRGPVQGVAWSPGGDRLAVTCGRTLRVHDVRSRTEAPALFETGPHDGRISGVTWSPDGAQIATASVDQTARIWDGATGAFRMILRGYAGALVGAAWHPRGDLVATWSEGGAAVVWSAANGEPRARLIGHEGSLTRAAWRPDGGLLATTSMHGGTRLWDPGACGRIAYRGHGAALTGAAWHPRDAGLALSASQDGAAHLWSPATGERLHALIEGQDGTPDPAWAAWSPDGLTVATLRESELRPTIWDAATRRPRAPLAPAPSGGGGGPAPESRLAFSPQGTLLAAKRRRSVAIWDVASGALLGEIGGRGDADGADVVSIAWSPVAPGAPEERPLLAVSRWLAQGSVALFNPRAPARPWCVLEDDTDGVWCVDFRPDGARIATACNDGNARVYDATTGARLAILPHDAAVRVVAWSPDGRLLATGDASQRVAIWRVDGDPVEVVSAPDHHLDAIQHLVWTRDGKRLLSSSADGMAKVWEELVGAGQPGSWSAVAILEGHRASVVCASLSPDGADVVTAGEDGIALVHPVSFASLLPRVGALLHRVEMTAEEWARSMGPHTPRRPTWPRPAAPRR